MLEFITCPVNFLLPIRISSFLKSNESLAVRIPACWSNILMISSSVSRSALIFGTNMPFKNSARALRSQSGLDYTKSILIKDLHYLDLSAQAVVDPDEYKETMINLPRIVREVYRYLSDYTDDLNGIQKLHPKEWQRRYGKSTLPYFNDFLTAGP